MSRSVLSAGNDIRDILLADEELSELVGTRIFPLVAPADTEGAFITYGMEKYDIMRTKFGAYDEIATFTYYIFSSDPDEALEIAEAFRRVILGVRIDGRGLDITGAENTLTEYEIKGKAWYAYIFPLRVSNLDYRR